MQYRIVIEDGLMMVMDDDGNGYDCHVLDEAKAASAEQRIYRWADEYQFDVVRAKRDLAEYFQDQ